MSRKFYILLLLLFTHSVIAFGQTIKGRVSDQKGNPLVGATVVVEELQKAEITDEQGKFRLTHLPQSELTISVRLLGYDRKSQKLNLASNPDPRIQFEMKANTDLDEVEVFGERFKQPEKLDAITRMPLRPSEQIQSISVISDKVIAQQGVLTIADAMRNVPGVTLFGSYGGVKESMSARGFRGIPVLKNGVRIDSQFQTASGIADMQGVESIQMIKGSAAVTQGVITDIGNAGGVINVVTKTPKFINGGEVGIRVGSWGQFRPTFDVQTVLDKNNTVAVRLNGAYERADNYRPVVSSERVYVNPSLEWRPSDKTTINLEMDYLNEDRTPVTSTVNLSSDSILNLYKMPHNKFLGTKNDNVNTEITTYSARIKHQLTKNYSLRASYFGSSYQMDNVSTGLKTPNNNKPNTDYNMRERTLSRSLRDDKNTTTQFDFIGQDVYTGSVKHTFQVGFDYRTANAATKSMKSIAKNIDVIDVTADIISIPKIEGTIFENSDTIRAVYNKYTTYGMMAQEVMTINKYVKAILGVRYSSIATKGDYIKRENAWDPVLGIMISPIENLNVFGSYTTSTNLRNASYILTDSITRAGASRTKQFEVGIKSDWLNNRLRFNFTYFHILTNNLANSEYKEGTTTTTGYYYKAGDLKREGIEIELNGRILPNLQVMLGYAYLDARYDNSPSYKNGSAPMNAPKHTANGWVQYEVNKGPLKRLSAGVGIYYVGERPVNDHSIAPDGHGSMTGAKPFDMPAYTTVNAQLGYNIKNFTARVFFNNIFDKLGYNSYYRGGYINQIDPRNFAGQISYRF